MVVLCVMKTIGEKVKFARLSAQLSKSDLATLVGVSPSTITRIEQNKLQPRAGMYLNILAESGLRDAGDVLEIVSDPTPIYTIRWLCNDLETKPDGAEKWVGKWQRLGLMRDLEIQDASSLMFRAGRCADLFARPNSITAILDIPKSQIVETLNNASIDFSITGDWALELYGCPIESVWPVLYVDNLSNTLRSLNLKPKLPDDTGTSVTFIEYDGMCEKNSIYSGNIQIASPLQTILDGFSGYGRMIEQSEELLKW